MKEITFDLDGVKYHLIFEGCALSGRAILSINGEQDTYSPLPTRTDEFFFLIEINKNRLIIKTDIQKNMIDINVNGNYLLSGAPLEPEVSNAYLNFASGRKNPSRLLRGELSVLFAYTIFSYVNMILFLLNSTFLIPLSAIVPQYIMYYAMLYYQEMHNAWIIVIGVMVSITIITFYLFFYLLSQTKTWALIFSLALVISDSLVLLYVARGSFLYFLYDIIFHAGLIVMLVIRLYQRKKRRLYTNKPSEHAEKPL